MKLTHARRWVLPAAVLASASFLPDAHATRIGSLFSGQVTSVTPGAPSNIAIGAPVSGGFFYDTTAIPSSTQTVSQQTSYDFGVVAAPYPVGIITSAGGISYNSQPISESLLVQDGNASTPTHTDYIQLTTSSNLKGVDYGQLITLVFNSSDYLSNTGRPEIAHFSAADLNPNSGGTTFGWSGDTGFWNFAYSILSMTPLNGLNLSDPVLPVSQDNGTFHFVATNIDWFPRIFDPAISEGYRFRMLDGGAFSSVELPPLSAVNNTFYIVTAEGISTELPAGTTFNFPSGIADFTITGINPALGLDPNDPLAFPVGLAFTDANPTVTFDMIPISGSSAILEPGSLYLIVTGLAGLAFTFLTRRSRFSST